MIMKRLLTICIECCLIIGFANGQPKTSAVNLAQATIVYHEGDAPLVKQMAQVLADDFPHEATLFLHLRSLGTQLDMDFVCFLAV